MIGLGVSESAKRAAWDTNDAEFLRASNILLVELILLHSSLSLSEKDAEWWRVSSGAVGGGGGLRPRGDFVEDVLLCCKRSGEEGGV